MTPLLKVEKLKLNVRVRPNQYLAVVEGISFEMNQGDTLGIIGISGCGKSSLVQGLLGCVTEPLQYTSGDIRLDGQPLFEKSPQAIRTEVLGSKIAMIPQQALAALNPHRRILNFASDMVRSHFREMTAAESSARLQARAEQLDLPLRILNSYPGDLDLSSRMLIVIAISTLMNPRLLIVDDPWQGLDNDSRWLAMTMLKHLQELEIIQSMILTTQNEIELISLHTQRTASMFAGEFQEFGFTQQVLHDPRHPYTKALLTQDPHAPHTLQGPPPGQNGCPFASQCSVAHPDCIYSRQMVRTVGDRDVRCAYAQ